jgi:hypothetical protein
MEYLRQDFEAEIDNIMQVLESRAEDDPAAQIDCAELLIMVGVETAINAGTDSQRC